MYLIIEPLPSVKLGMMASLPEGHVDWNEERFIAVSLPDDSIVFYDWVRDDAGRIVGMELCPWAENADMLRDLRSAHNGGEGGDVRIMFVPGGAGPSDATQGFGNISFYRGSTGRWLIAIDTRWWLKPGDVERLEQIICAGHRN